MPELSFTLANIVQTLFIFLGILGSALLFDKQRYRGVMLLLGYFALLMTFNLLEELRISTQFLFITPSFTLLMGPILYFMVMSLVNAPESSHWNWLTHCIPALISLPFTSHLQWVVAFGSLSQLVYLVISYKLLRRYNAANLNTRSDALSLQLNWVEQSSIAIIAFLLFDMVRLNIRPFLSMDIYYLWYLIDLIIILLICCYLLIKAVKQPELFDGLVDYERNEPTNEKNVSTKQTRDQSELAQQIFRALDNQIKQSELYKTPKLTVQHVATQSGVAVKETSWAINEIAGKNFNDYINTMRIEAVKEQLTAQAQSQSQKSILDIALECGFNSKSTFNLAFKKLEGVTPSHFVKERG